MSRRKVVAPAWYQDSDTEIDEPVVKRKKRTATNMKDSTSVPQMPTMPSFQPSMELFSQTEDQNTPTLFIRTNTLDEAPTRDVFQSYTALIWLFGYFIHIIYPYSIFPYPSHTSTPATSSCENDSSIPSYVRCLFMRLDRIERSLSNIMSILVKDMQSQNPEIEELSRQLQTVEELEQACENLTDTAYKKKWSTTCVFMEVPLQGTQ
ncbi:uncharacterized protein LOC125886587 [Epinephelus fuscoguttatus]|uniref:uncharacterized protein LOC125886587 n=1 Tax=Epinephelus fuscoguttatus TaxID=293821 RepID=UPI0020D082B8|nr:uncharacterized protein LOC125886587 [Epinephelus fuscoguttatus]